MSALRARALARPFRLAPPTTLSPQRASFSQTLAPRGGGHESIHDPPTGWLFGVKPGEKYQKEGWEDLTFYGLIPIMVIFVGVYAFKPDTSIQTWALEEARRRLEAEGILPDPDVKKE